VKRLVSVLGSLRRLTVAVLVGCLGASASAATAAAAPPLPAPPPYLPGVPYPYPGSYNYGYNLIPVSGPAVADARGVRATANADPAMQAQGLPGSELGLAPNKSNVLGTSSSTRYHISAGPAPTQTVQPGISVGAGVVEPTVEDPGGAAPKTPTAAESTPPTTAPAVPGNGQILEDPKGQPAAAATAPTPTPAPGPPTPEVMPQTSGFTPGAYGTGTGPGISAGQ
jgi:hypothetical protein